MRTPSGYASAFGYFKCSYNIVSVVPIGFTCSHFKRLFFNAHIFGKQYIFIVIPTTGPNDNVSISNDETMMIENFTIYLLFLPN